MALDGIVISNIVTELNDRLSGARIAKIAQPEADEILLTCKSPAGQARLLLRRCKPSAYLSDFHQQTLPCHCSGILYAPA